MSTQLVTTLHDSYNLVAQLLPPPGSNLSAHPKVQQLVEGAVKEHLALLAAAHQEVLTLKEANKRLLEESRGAPAVEPMWL
jgi:hypothetical protein